MAELLGADAHDLGAKLAYRPWEQRGRPFDSPDGDWLAAANSGGPANQG